MKLKTHSQQQGQCKVVPVHITTPYKEVLVQLHAFLTSNLKTNSSPTAYYRPTYKKREFLKQVSYNSADFKTYCMLCAVDW